MKSLMVSAAVGALMLGLGCGEATANGRAVNGNGVTYGVEGFLAGLDRDIDEIIRWVLEDDDDEEVRVVYMREPQVRTYTRSRRQRGDPCDGTGVRGCSGTQFRVQEPRYVK